MSQKLHLELQRSVRFISILYGTTFLELTNFKQKILKLIKIMLIMVEIFTK